MSEELELLGWLVSANESVAHYYTKRPHNNIAMSRCMRIIQVRCLSKAGDHIHCPNCTAMLELFPTKGDVIEEYDIFDEHKSCR